MTQMGHYRCEAKTVSRAAGRSSVSVSAYNAAIKMTDERTGITFDYRAKQGVVHSEIVTPDGSPAWAQDRAVLWSAAELAEDKSTRRADAKTGRNFILDLPHELDAEAHLGMARQFAAYLVSTYGVAVDFGIHLPDRHGDSRNHHVHMLTSTRRMTDAGFGGKVRELDSPRTSGKHMEAIRAKWAELQNDAYQVAGLDVRVTHLSYEDQGLDKLGGVHLGPAASAMERQGIKTERGNINRAVAEENEARALRAELAGVESQIADIVEVLDLSVERQARVEADAERRRSLVNTDGTLNHAAVLDRITKKAATFTRPEVERAIAGVFPDRAERRAAADALLADFVVIGLSERLGESVTRYTTRAILAEERGVLDAARRMDERGGFAVSHEAMAFALNRHSKLDAEQRTAFFAVLQDGGFAMIAGEAGTGKSTVIAAVRDAYEYDGFHVIGMSWTNAVVQDMAADGFKDARTVASEFHTWRGGGGQGADWNARTVIIVDEAAMLANPAMANVIGRAEAAGAKVTLVGDDAQLASIERGGLFGALRQERGAAELAQVYRVKDEEQQRAFNAMHERDFATALGIFDKRGAIQWTEDSAAASAALVAKWADDTAAEPGKTRFVFAYTNREVLELNAALRAVRAERGDLGADHRLNTKDGTAAYATGDRLQFTGGRYSREQKRAGIVNGAVGTVRAIDGNRVTVELDTKAGKPPRLVTFAAGDNQQAGEIASFRHGYAGTIYKGQGRTLDASYLLHSEHWRSASSYVALSRHREDTNLFVGRDATRGREPWMMAEGGADALDAKHRESAERSYALWADENPGLAERYGFENYVAYVQDRHAERGRNEFDMAQLVQQFSRVDENRAASQFIAMVPQTAPAGGMQPDFATEAPRSAATGTQQPTTSGEGKPGMNMDDALRKQADAQQRAEDRERLQAGTVSREALQNEKVVRLAAEAQAKSEGMGTAEQIAAGRGAVKAYQEGLAERQAAELQRAEPTKGPDLDARGDAWQQVADTRAAERNAGAQAQVADWNDGKAVLQPTAAPIPEKAAAQPTAEPTAAPVPTQEAAAPAPALAPQDAETKRKELLAGLDKAEKQRDTIEAAMRPTQEASTTPPAQQQAASKPEVADRPHISEGAEYREALRAKKAEVLKKAQQQQLNPTRGRGGYER